MSSEPNQLLQWLSGGDLRSDGMADQAAAFVLRHPETFEDLFEGLSWSDDVIRARAADALEKVARSRPDLLVERLDEVVALAQRDQVPMVLMHLAMIFGHLAIYAEWVDVLFTGVVGLLGRKSLFVRSWAIVSLCIIGTVCPDRHRQAVELVLPLQSDASAAIRSRAKKAIHLLTQEGAVFPKGWIKSEHLKYLETSRPATRTGSSST